MIYAHLIDGLDPERREQFDAQLASSGGDTKSQAKRERAVIDSLMKLPVSGVGR